MKRADRSGARVALILGEDEVAEQMVGVKPLREDAGQDNIGWAELSTRLPGYIK
jgi:histidyl-tRNA synthetase